MTVQTARIELARAEPHAPRTQLKALFDGGYDVVSAQTASNNVQARIQVNQSRGVMPP